MSAPVGPHTPLPPTGPDPEVLLMSEPAGTKQYVKRRQRRAEQGERTAAPSRNTSRRISIWQLQAELSSSGSGTEALERPSLLDRAQWCESRSRWASASCPGGSDQWPWESILRDGVGCGDA